MKRTEKNEKWLVNWSYNPKEWFRFIKNKNVCRNRLKGMLCLLGAICFKKDRIVKISSSGVLAGGNWLFKAENGYKISGAGLEERDSFNLLELVYKTESRSFSIEFPVPKGKIREAWEMVRQFEK